MTTMKVLDNNGLVRLVTNLYANFATKEHGNHVPTTETANNAKFLRNDNSWQTVTPANIGAVGSGSADYIKGASVSGKTLTLTKGDNTTVTFTETNTDTKVTNSLDTATKFYVTGTTSATTNTGTQTFDTGVYVSTTAGELVATKFTGALNGNANTASKINTGAKIGDTNKPVYVAADGTITPISYTVSKSVPSDAVFTDTTYSNFVGSGSTAAAGLVPAPSTTAGTTKFLREDGSWEVPAYTTNTDTKVTNTKGNTTKFYVTGTTSSSTNTGTQYFDTGVYVSTTAGELVATKFTGELNGKANDSDKLGGTAASSYALKTYVDTAVAGIVDSAPDTLNTLNELSAALGDDPNFATTIATQIGGKVATGSADYIKSASVSGKTLTLTKGDDTTVTFTETDTQYTHPSAGANTGSFGPSANASPAHGGTFSVPYLTVNSDGHVTAISTKTITLPEVPTSVTSATKLSTARAIDGVNFDGSAAITHYGTCSTAAATAAKTVACTSYTLVTGSRIIVKFTVTNTAANPTLNVNSTGAKAIQYRGAAITAGYLAANRTYEFVYDGTNYQLIGDIDANTTESLTNTEIVEIWENYF